LSGQAAGIVATSPQSNTPGDGCQPIMVDLTGKYALISRGGCLFDEKVINNIGVYTKNRSAEFY
jgi:hypothetical protein